jgi:predicted PurR-regulated permease PerM
MFTILLFGTFTTFFLLQDGDLAWDWAMQAASERRRAAATESGLRGLGQVGGYLRTVALLAAVEAAVDYVLLVILGVPLALPLAMLVFVGGFVPYLGGLVATSAVLLAALASIGPEATLVLLGLIVVANILEERFLGRARSSTAVHVHPAIILVVLPIGAFVAGFFGLVLAVPIAAFVLATGGSILDAIRPDPEEEAESNGPTVVPDWLDVLAQWSWRLLIGIAVIALGVAAVVQVPIVLLPIIVAAVLASTFAPLTRALRHRGWGTSVSAGIVTVGAYVGIGLIVVVTIAALLSNVDKVTGDASGGAGSIDSWLEGLAGLLRGLVDAIGSGLAGTVASVLVNLVVLTLAVVFGAILTFFFLRDGQAAWAAVTRGLAPAATRGGRAAGRRSGCSATTWWDGRYLGVRRADPARRHGGAGHPARAPARGAVLLRRVHPLHRQLRDDRPCVPRDRRHRRHHGHRGDGHLHDRVQHRPGQHRRAARIRQGRQHPPGDRPARHPGGQRRGRRARDVPGGAVPGRGRHDLADGAGRHG